MAKKKNTSKEVSDLRRRAEEKIVQSPPEKIVQSPPEKIVQSPPEKMERSLPEETQRVLHELRVHQVELEMQNEELQTSQVDLEVAQMELEAERRRYFDLYDLAPVGYCTVSEEDLILEANLTVATLLDVPRGALVKRPFPNFISPEDQDINYFHRKQLFQSNEPQSFDLRMLKKDGTVFWAHLVATTAQDPGGATVCRVMISDITERKRSENELKKNQELSEALFDYNPIETIVVDRSGRIVKFNMEKRNSGDKLPQAGDMMYKDYAGRHESDMRAELMKCMKTGEIGEFTDLKYADKFLTVKIAPFPDGAIITAIDVTARKKSENLLEVAYRKLDLTHNKLLSAGQSERLAFTGRIASGIAHEIRNPSATISLSMEQLSGTLKLKGKQVQFFEIIPQPSHRVNVF